MTAGGVSIPSRSHGSGCFLSRCAAFLGGGVSLAFSPIEVLDTERLVATEEYVPEDHLREHIKRDESPLFYDKWQNIEGVPAEDPDDRVDGLQNHSQVAQCRVYTRDVFGLFVRSPRKGAEQQVQEDEVGYGPDP